MVFKLIAADRIVTLQPRDLGKDIQNKIYRRLVEQSEGRCDPELGYIVCLERLSAHDKGRVDEITGAVSFRVSCRFLVFQLTRDEVIDGTCTSVTQHGFMVTAGPFVIFVSNKLVPVNMVFDESPVPQYVDAAASMRVQKGTEVRVQVTSLTFMGENFTCLGSIRGDFLGPVS
nr:DNA-directed RNA polymerase II subunit RPB7 [Seculamonas ecuadoriensis]